MARASAMHKEDIKAALRKRYGSLRSFELNAHIAIDSTRDVLRGRRIAATENAMARVLEQPLHVLFPQRYPTPDGDQSTIVDNNAGSESAHGLNGEAA